MPPLLWGLPWLLPVKINNSFLYVALIPYSAYFTQLCVLVIVARPELLYVLNSLREVRNCLISIHGHSRYAINTYFMKKFVNIPRKSTSKQTYWVLRLLERWTTWGSLKQCFHSLLVPYTNLPVWLQKNDLDHLLKILIPGLLFQSFLSGNVCFDRLPRWLYAKPCLGVTGIECVNL